ncbi:JAB domain-containing protein [Odoribacter lunatus]|uniref:JAB domain-containing protein n=1 Tax=Odoribacter lunatus TaxID=2941335 RepID=UPI0020410870|nr:JAB domain-containing protein [Odoribacter lunatus]
MKTLVSEIKVTYSPKVRAKDRFCIHDSKDAYDLLMKDAFREETIEYKEYVKVILLNRANRVLGIYSLSEGGMDTTVIDVRLILQVALLTHSAAFILAHNHTGGQLQPSTLDNAITEKVKKAATLLNIILHDHLIVSKEGYYSYTDEGRL